MNAIPNQIGIVPVQLEPDDFLKALDEEHCSWLSSFDQRYSANFEKLRNGDYEAAMTEASVRRFLVEQDIGVEPAEDLTGMIPRPDFLCTSGVAKFFVEVTCIGIQKVIEQTGLPYPTQRGACHYSPLNDAFWKACKGKAAQCGNLPYPSLVAVGTHHTAASYLCVDKSKVDMLLTGTTNISWTINSSTGNQVGSTYLSTDLHSAAFIRSSSGNTIGVARGSVSGLMLCGFGTLPPNVLGILHPNPVRPFDRQWIPRVPFCAVTIDHQTETLSTNWS